MKNFLAVLFLISIIAISGCAQKGAKPVNQTQQNNVLASMCKDTGKVNVYTLDSDGSVLQKAELILTLNSKCNLFAACDLDIERESQTFKLYALNANNETEKKIFGNLDFKAYIGLEAEADENNTTVFVFNGKPHPIKPINSNEIELDGKHLAKGENITIDGTGFKFYDFKTAPVFQSLAFEGKDVVSVIDDPQLTRVFSDPGGIGSYSVLIELSDAAIKKIKDLVKDAPITLSIGQGSQQASIKARIYYYADGDLLASANLPAELKSRDDIKQLTILGVFASPKIAVRNFELLRNSLKLYGYPQIKILKTEQFDCRDVLDKKIDSSQSVSSYLKDCGSDWTCIKPALESCTPIKASIDFYDYSDRNFKGTLEITGKEKDLIHQVYGCGINYETEKSAFSKLTLKGHMISQETEKYDKLMNLILTIEGYLEGSGQVKYSKDI